MNRQRRAFFSSSGIGTAKNASDQLDIHLLNTLNQMLQKWKSGLYDYSSDILHHAIKQAYFELDKDLKRLVKDESGCVCVRISSFHSDLPRKIPSISV